jgi:hypothetical protein
MKGTTAASKGICDAHEPLMIMLKEIKDELKDIKGIQSKQNDYIVGKQAENGVTTVIAQKQDTQKDSALRNFLQVTMMIIAIAAIVVGALR